MARKSQYRSDEKGAEISDLLDALEQLLERTRVMYEQYFMGIQKVAPMQLHRDLERKLRDLSQEQIRNTALRYRLNTMVQKYGVYNTYWRRVIREIEEGRYIRDMARVKRRALRSGEDIPEEILAAMPKIMRDSILRERERLAQRMSQDPNTDSAESSLHEEDDEATEPNLAVIRNTRPERPSVYKLDDGGLGDLFDEDLDELFKNLADSAEAAVSRYEAPKPAAPPPKPAAPAPKPAAPPVGAAQPKPAAPPPAPGSRPAPPPVPTAAGGPRPAPPPPPRPAPPPPPRHSQQSQKPMAAQSPDAGPRPAPPPAGSKVQPDVVPGMSEAQARSLYKRYLNARQTVGESTNISFEKLVSTLRAQAPKIMQEHNAKGVEFNVVVKNDKVILKAKPKKD